jgi:hypothetical protein
MADQRIAYTEEVVGSGHATKSDTLNRLALVEHSNDGTHSIVLTTEHNADGTHKFKGALVNRATDQSIGTATTTVVAWDAEQYDTDSVHDNVTNNSRLTVPSGVTRVRLAAYIVFGASATGNRKVNIRKNGGASYWGYASYVMAGLSGTPTEIIIQTPPIVVTPGDYFEVTVYQDSGVTLPVMSSYLSWFAMERVM